MDDKRSDPVWTLQRLQVLDSWLQETNTRLIQVNGQRKYGGPPPGWTGPPPGPRCEVFISQIPRDSYEDQLIPLFGSVGPLWEFRLMMNFSGQNRGFAYARYGAPGVAGEAIRLLHGYALEPGAKLSVRRSTEKRHLCVGSLPDSTAQDDLLQMLRSLTDGVERLSLKAGPGIEGVSAIVAFTSHHAASMAKKVLVEAMKKRFSLSVTISWQSAAKSSLDDSFPLDRPSKNAASSPQKPPRHPATCRPLPIQPPRMLRPQGFCRAVGGPTAPPPTAPPPTSSLQGCRESMAPVAGTPSPPSAVALLRDQLLYDIRYSHAAPEGFLCFTYKVLVPGVAPAFQGHVMILPGASAAATVAEAQHAAAQQVLQRLSRSLFTD